MKVTVSYTTTHSSPSVSALFLSPRVRQHCSMVNESKQIFLVVLRWRSNRKHRPFVEGSLLELNERREEEKIWKHSLIKTLPAALRSSFKLIFIQIVDDIWLCRTHFELWTLPTAVRCRKIFFSSFLMRISLLLILRFLRLRYYSHSNLSYSNQKRWRREREKDKKLHYSIVQFTLTDVD